MSSKVNSVPRRAAAPTNKRATKGGSSLKVIGIGASAGGLEAIEAFLSEAGCLRDSTFVVIQHLGAGTPSLLPELLQRATRLPVESVESGAPVQPDVVYVVPPGCDLTIDKGRFVLTPQQAGAGHKLPIDAFFRSLAAAYGDRAVGVVLSGMGSDGTKGLAALKASGGAAFAQAPDSAQFDSMPRSALQAGLADAAAAPADLPALIAAHLLKLQDAHGEPVSIVADDPQALEAIVQALRAQTGHEFADYKKSTLQRRIERRMGVHQCRTLDDYSRLLRENKPEAELLFKELLIGVTSFFRDPRVWDHLRDVVLPEFLRGRSDNKPLRLWVPGCSTGEEAYTLAMVLTEALQAPDAPAPREFRIFATDIDSDAIDRARQARYPLGIAGSMSAERLARFFVRDDTGYQIRKDLRETVIFALQNVAMDPPFTKLDMLVCRNLMIYFEPALQRRLLRLFHYSLEPGGLLLLGRAETTGQAGDHFVPVPGEIKLFRRLETFRSSGFVAFPATFDRPVGLAPQDSRASPADDGDLGLQALADHLLLQRYSPAAVLVNREGDVLYVSGKTGRYLEPAAGKANWNVFAMAREGLSRPLGAAFKDAVRTQRGVSVDGSVFDPDLGARKMRVTVDPITSPTLLAGMLMIVFRDVEPDPNERAAKDAARPKRGDAGDLQLAELRDALRAARDEARSAEAQSRASNEEWQSTIEELQSTNEELTTSKEELQSMNEELQTVNQELQAKVDELSQASDDMRNLLNSTEIATVFLDELLHIRRFTAQAVSVFKLIPTDIGRPITDITNALEGWDVARDAQEVLHNLVPKEREVPASGERFFRVRMMPYRTSTNRIDGVVITLSDVSAAKRLEQRLTGALKTSERRAGDGVAAPPARKRAPTSKRP
ncbi:protein-glutamate O-methyltransferase OS=Rhizobacter sp. Root404 OX=1736528 GN=ASC76_08015 PE=4 SV=1 [Rhizobacter fulvus]